MDTQDARQAGPGERERLIVLAPKTALACAVLSIVAMLVVPLPPALLDVLLSCDVMGAAAVLVVALSVEDPLELSAFPALLLVATLFRLGLDVSATRLILTQGAVQGGVGSVIPAFGDFVMRGNPVVGLLLFVILVVVQLVVVTNGAQRVAEVAARFTLDAMPGKQMAIDADLHAGIIDASGARARRRALQAEADFYGAMDGAGKFVRGDAVAALVIVAVNLVAGFAIGVVQDRMDVASAAQTFALLSIGNALATTLPAFLLSTAMGIMVTRAASDVALGEDIARQLFAHPGALRAVGAAMLALAAVPGLPHAAFGLLGVSGFVGGAAAARSIGRGRLQRAQDEAQRRRAQSRQPEQAVALLGVDHLAIDVGESLLPLLDEPAASALLSRIAAARHRLALDLGVVMPGVRVRDDARLPARGYAIRVRDRVVARGELHPDRPMAIGAPAVLSSLKGIETVDPVTGSDARWLEPGAPPAIGRDQARRQRIRIHHGTGRVSRACDHDAFKRATPVSDHQRFAGHGPACFGGGFDQHRLTAERAQNMAVGRIAGIGQRHPVARLEHRQEGQDESARGAGSHHHAGGIERQIIGLRVVAGDSPAQRRYPERLGIADAPVLQRSLRRLNGCHRRGRCRLPHLHMHNTAALRLDSGCRRHHVHDDKWRHIAAFGGHQQVFCGFKHGFKTVLVALGRPCPAVAAFRGLLERKRFS